MRVGVSTGGADPITDCHPPGSRMLPYGWSATTIGGAAPCWSTSYEQINGVYERLRRRYGISNCMCTGHPRSLLSLSLPVPLPLTRASLVIRRQLLGM